MAYTYTELKESRRCDYTKEGIVETKVYIVQDNTLGAGELINLEGVILDAKADSRFRLGAENTDLQDTYAANISVEETSNLKTARMTVRYEPGDHAAGFNDDGELWEFDLSSTQVSVLDTAGQAYENIGIGGRTDLVGSVIGLQQDGSIKGAEVYRPTWNMKCTKLLKSFSSSTLRTMFITARSNAWGLIAKTNNAVWMGFPTESVLFLGANITKKSPVEWQFEYNFNVAPPSIIEDITLSDGGTCGFSGYISGHQIVDITHDFTLVDGEKVYGIRNVGLRRVYPLADFTALGLTGYGII